MVSGPLALLKNLVIYMNVKQGSSPDRVRSPVEWGEIPSVRLQQLYVWTFKHTDTTVTNVQNEVR